jgi:hypothetical protein
MAIGALARAARSLQWVEEFDRAGAGQPPASTSGAAGGGAASAGAGGGGIPVRGRGPVARFPVEGRPAAEYLNAATRAAQFVRSNLWDERSGRLTRSYCRAPSAVQGALTVVFLGGG